MVDAQNGGPARRLSAIKEGAEKSAGEAPEEPDQLTEKGLKKEKRDERKSKSAGIRADEAHDNLLQSHNETISWLKQQHAIKDGRIATLEVSVANGTKTAVELERLKSPRRLRRCVLGCCGLFTASGAVAIAAFPQDSTGTLLGLKSETVFGGGLTMTLIAAVITFVLSIKD